MSGEGTTSATAEPAASARTQQFIAQNAPVLSITVFFVAMCLLFAIGSDVWQEGTGPPNLSFCFGLLLYEYLFAESPYPHLQATKRRQHARTTCCPCTQLGC